MNVCGAGGVCFVCTIVVCVACGIVDMYVYVFVCICVCSVMTYILYLYLAQGESVTHVYRIIVNNSACKIVSTNSARLVWPSQRFGYRVN